ISGDYSADPIEIGFNAKYLADIIGQIDGGGVELHLADSAAPTLIRESADAPALYVLMPMRV
ncbi:MAG: DNA polymerase III subunit beta, partial [Pseudomonadota bacterium]